MPRAATPCASQPGFAERLHQDAEVPITHLICRTLTDLTELLNGLMHHEAKLAWGDAALSRADEVRRPEPGSRRPIRMPGSRRVLVTPMSVMPVNRWHT
jgi:error-prone DNA polymerase